jgi:hypothetical protein
MRDTPSRIEGMIKASEARGIASAVLDNMRPKDAAKP